MDDYEFYICPITFISLQIQLWHKKYKHIKNGICKPIEYNTSNPKFFEAINIYEYYLDKFKEDRQQIEKDAKEFQKLKEAKLWRMKK